MSPAGDFPSPPPSSPSPSSSSPASPPAAGRLRAASTRSAWRSSTTRRGDSSGRVLAASRTDARRTPPSEP